MSSRKIVLLALALPALGLTIYSLKYSGKLCGGENANLKRQQCPQLYECVLESNQPNALGVCRFLPNGLRLGIQPAKGKPAVESPTPKDPTVERNEQNKKAQRLTLAQNKFGFELLKTLALTDQTNTQNIAISPTSLGLAFDLLYNGAYGSTKDQLTTVLQIPSFSLIELNEAAKILLDRINTPTQDIDTTLANSIWIRTGETLNAAVLRDAAAYYLAHIANLDFTQPEASKTINDWISNRTAGKIPNALPGQIDAATIAYLINTAYFNGVWQYQFDPQQISMRDFYKQDGSRSPTQSMRMTRSNFLYLENEDLQAVKLPYGSEQKYSMVLLLPKSLGVNNLLQMLTATNWESWLSGFTEKEGTLYLPKFSLTYGGSMVGPLKNIGMVLPFDPTKADFSGLAADGVSKNLYVSNVIHNTHLDVNENGTEAAAATIIEISFASAEPDEEPPFTMDINKPFFFAIIHEETQAALFIGIVRGL